MRLSLDGLWVAIAILLPALVALLVPMPAVDLAYQVRAGNEILATGSIPRLDTWTFTVWGTLWLDQQWLAQVVLAAGHALGGWELLAVVRAALVGVTTALLVAVGLVVGVGARTGAILALVAFALMAPALALRPQLMGIALFAGLLLLVAGRRRWPRVYWFAPALVLVWANVHGSFVLGPVLLGYAWLDDLVAGRPGRRQSLWVLVFGSLATLINPFVFNVWTYAAGIGASPAIASRVSEWQRTSPFGIPGLLFYPSVAVTAVLLLRSRQRTSWPTWALAVGMAVIGAWAVRGVAWWAIVMVFLVATALATDPRIAVEPTPRARRANALNAAAVAVLAVALIAALPWWRPPDPLSGRVGLLSFAPTALATELAGSAEPGQRVAVPQTWASWFEWAVPDALYYIDSRFELYPPDVWDGYDDLAAGGTVAGDAVDRWAIDIVVVPPGATEPDGRWDSRIDTPEGTILVGPEP